jgi:predicted dehydrogenase
MNFVVAGIGTWGREWAELLAGHSETAVVATVDVAPNAATWSKNRLDVPCFESLDVALDAVAADAVLIVTNPGQHKPLFLTALQRGKHVLCEKPMVASWAEASEVESALKSSQSTAMVAQGYRFLESAAEVRRRLAGGEIGTLRAVKIRFRRHLPDVISQPDHPIYALPHSILLDMSVHHFDLLRYMTQREVLSILAMEHDTPDNAFTHASNAICVLRLTDDLPVVWDGDWCARGPITSWEGEWQFIGSTGRLYWDGMLNKTGLTSVRLERPRQTAQEIRSDEPILERRIPVVNHFVASIKNGVQPEPSVADNRRTLAAVFGAIKSVEEKREIVLAKGEL